MENLSREVEAIENVIVYIRKIGENRSIKIEISDENFAQHLNCDDDVDFV